MRGYSTQFAQLECLKLVASDSFSAKRVGYLGLMLLLDEESEVLMLVTNSLKNDLNHPNMYVVGLALCSLGNMCTADMGRDLAGEVEKLLSSTNHYVRKKAALCAQRIIKRCPDLLENFVGLAKSQLVKRHHGVLLTGISLMITMCEVDPAVIVPFRRFIPALVGALKSLVVSSYAPEHDVGGITDPFIQVKLLRLLRILGKDDVEASEKMNDVLAHVATHTEVKLNVGNAILYEVVQTIMTIEAESGLRLLAINILGRFLLNRDNNIRYVALNTLSRALRGDLGAVQRHRSTILQCLKDPDVSIRRRALELTYKLVTDRNANDLISELCLFVDVIDEEFRPALVENLLRLADAFSQGDRWHANLALRILRSAGSYVTQEVADSIIVLFSRLDSEQQYVVKRLYEHVNDDMSSEALKRVAAWSIGEFAELLSSPGGGTAVEHITCTDDQVVSALEFIDSHAASTLLTKMYVLTAVIKLSTRLSSDSAHARILSILEGYQNSVHVELQQRACEYAAIYQLTGMREALLERIPVLEEADGEEGDEGEDDDDEGEDEGEDVSAADGAAVGAGASTAGAAGGGGGGASLLDLMSGGPSPTPGTTTSGGVGAAGGGSTGSLLDLLSGPAEPTTTTAPPPSSAGTGGGSLMDLLSSPDTGAAAAASSSATGAGAGAAFAPVTVYEKNNVKIVYAFAKQPGRPEVTAINATFTNGNPFPLTELTYRVAVPTYIQLKLAPATGTTIPASNSGSVSQVINLLNSQHGSAPVLLKFQLAFKANGTPFTEQGDVAGLPAGL